ncbi:MAG: heavy-metal-associated domain-containing protein [Clostridia bacterium]|nr:heavy-metal-associated domain-containing protein [Clostridia bacterium]
MKKTLKFTEIDCANCAAKVEKNISKLDGVESVRVVFLTQKIILEVDETADWDNLLKQIEKAAKKVEPDCEITEK